MIKLALYRPFRFAVAIALLLSLAMPMVTFACDLTGLIETPVTMAAHAGMAESSASDCPCEGPMQDMCGVRAADCPTVVDCHGDSLDTDACCSSQPGLEGAIVSSSMGLDRLQPALVSVTMEQHHDVPDDIRLEAPRQERAPPRPVKTPVHILHSSLLL